MLVMDGCDVRTKPLYVRHSISGSDKVGSQKIYSGMFVYQDPYATMPYIRFILEITNAYVSIQSFL